MRSTALQKFGKICVAILIIASLDVQAKDLSEKVSSDVIKSEKFGDVKELVVGAGQNTLVVFDIDDTLLTSETFFGSDHWYEWQRGLKKGDAGYVPCKFDVIALNYEMGTQRVVEPDSVDIVRAVTADMIYLTARNPAYRGATHRELDRAKYPFPKAISEKVDGTIFRLKDSASGREADVSYRSGVYMVSGLGKGDALVELLRRAGKSYGKVILVDDGEKNILSMKMAMESKSISYVGFHYLRVSKSLPLYREMVESSNNSWSALKGYLNQTYPKRAEDFELERCNY